MISVIIPVWNHAKEVLDCLKSLERQTYKDFEVIIVDDGSTDELDSRLRTNHPRSFALQSVRFEKNQGAPAARNEGFRRSKGSYVIFLDADAILEPEALSFLLDQLKTHPEAAFAYSSFYFGWKFFPCRSFDAEALKDTNYIHTSALIRREAFPGFDESLKKFQDWDLWLTIVERGGMGTFIPKPLFRLQVNRRKGRMSDWLPSFMYRLPWPLFGYVPRAIKRYREAEQIIKQKHQTLSAQSRGPTESTEVLDQKGKNLMEGRNSLSWFFGIACFEVLSLALVFYPSWNGIAALLAGLIIFVLTIYRPEFALTIVAAEYLIGSKGALLKFGGDLQNNGGVSLRIIFFVAFLMGWAIWLWRHKTWKDWNQYVRGRWIYALLGLLILYGILLGWVRGSRASLFQDANAWGAWLLLIPALDIVYHKKQKVTQIFLPAITAGFIWLFFKTMVLLYVFSHGFASIGDPLYLWIRRTGVGEIASRGGGAYRIFLQSHVYALFIAFAAWAGFVWNKINRQIAFALFILASTVIVVSLSRSFWMGTALGAMVFFFFVFRSNLVKIKTALTPAVLGSLLSVALIACVVHLPFPSTPWSAFTNLFFHRGLSEPAAMSRWELFPVLWHKIQQHPIIGSGFGATVTYASADPRTIAQFGSLYTTYAFEWGWLDFWIKFGIFGPLVLLALLVHLIRRTYSSHEPEWIKVVVISSICALGFLHFFTPYVNHPLGITALIFGEALLVFYQKERVDRREETL